jgi:hypothetical protein
MDNWWDDVDQPASVIAKLPNYAATLKPLSEKLRDGGVKAEWVEEAQRLEEKLNGIQTSLGLMIDLAMKLKRRLKGE